MGILSLSGQYGVYRGRAGCSTTEPGRPSLGTFGSRGVDQGTTKSPYQSVPVDGGKGVFQLQMYVWNQDWTIDV